MENKPKSIKNFMVLEFPSANANAEIAKAAITVLAGQMTPTPTHDDISNITTAVQEAVENASRHAYPDGLGMIHIRATIFNHNILEIRVTDKGPGIENLQKARTGFGFKVMEHWMDNVEVRSEPGKGTTVILQYVMDKQGK